MNKNIVNLRKSQTREAYAFLKIICFLLGSLSVVLVIFTQRAHPSVNIILPGLMFSISYFFIFFLLSYINSKYSTTTKKALREDIAIKENEQIKKSAYYDALTGLPNRYMLNDFVNDLLNGTDSLNYKCTVMFIDLDNFKKVNDFLGHNLGDAILFEAAKRLTNCVRKGDIIFRYGGDEFLIILDDIDEESIIYIAEKIITEFTNPFIVNRHETFISPSIGISFYTKDGDNVESLIKNADAAMHVVKNSGKNNYQFFSEELNKALSRRLELENGLRKAIENHEFTLCYQPQVDLNTGAIWGLEALIRWQHPTLGMISPSEFIPLAEETGLIVPIGEWVLETACRQNKLWQDSGLNKIPVAVNVSAIQLKQPKFIEMVKRQLHNSKLDPEYLVIEFTESIMQDTMKALKIVNDLKSLGVKVAIDDFGTGYSSLSLLKNLNIDILKVDSYFIKDIDTNRNTLTIIKLIIDMAHKLNFNIIVEGIETERQARIIKENNCKIGQGYLLSHPIPPEKTKIYLETY
ncbi:bifunctional diguanylate cyclase/phosphodiesterase [Clostridium sp. DJ247]|uniref:putative bifunctional diguanylate cyclase/phosphodiesterase n=1 Tax=Clostridium sp. DJ247 TaxID=2726188 RepID=UPI00162AC07C|nr:EAL domain-containing protein [Clostridium sp. DJ247]MBC2582771.1 EAL domain-containing protein [Clostridium sp. DJ247]